MNIRLRTIAFTAFVLSIPAVLIAAAGLNYTGFCIRKWSYLSNAEAIRAALLRQSSSIDGLPNPPSESELATFESDNPNCCVALRISISDDPIIDHITGFRKKWVRLLYRNKQDGRAVSEQFRDAHVAVLPCGDAVYAMAAPISENQMKTRSREIRQMVEEPK